MAELRLDAEPRSEGGKGPARRLRAAGKVPATIYGEGGDARSLAVDARDLSAALSTGAGVNALIDLHIGSETELAMARELDRDPIRGTIIHVDFLRIDRNKPITVDVPLHFEGTPIGVREAGGVAEHALWSLHVECLPMSVPDSITLDISELNVGDTLRAGDVQMPEGVTLLTAEDEMVATVIIPSEPVLEEEEPEEGLLEGEEGEAAAEGEEGASAAEGEASAEGGDEG